MNDKQIESILCELVVIKLYNELIYLSCCPLSHEKEYLLYKAILVPFQ